MKANIVPYDNILYLNNKYFMLLCQKYWSTSSKDATY